MMLNHMTYRRLADALVAARSTTKVRQRQVLIDDALQRLTRYWRRVSVLPTTSEDKGEVLFVQEEIDMACPAALIAECKCILRHIAKEEINSAGGSTNWGDK